MPGVYKSIRSILMDISATEPTDNLVILLVDELDQQALHVVDHEKATETLEQTPSLVTKRRPLKPHLLRLLSHRQHYMR